MNIPYLKIIGGAISTFLVAFWLLSDHSPSVSKELSASLTDSENKVVFSELSEVEQALANSEPVDEVFLENLKAELEASLNQPNIAREDILRGWYEAGKNEKRYGTPENWVFSEQGDKAIWGDPYVLAKLFNPLKEQCEAAGAIYVESCLESTDPSCKFVEKSQCQCGEKELWDEKRGCIQHPDF